MTVRTLKDLLRIWGKCQQKMIELVLLVVQRSDTILRGNKGEVLTCPNAVADRVCTLQIRMRDVNMYE